MALLNFANTYEEVSDKLHLEQSNTGDYIKLYFTKDGHIISHGVDYIPWGIGKIPIGKLPVDNTVTDNDHLWDSATIQDKINKSFVANDAMRFKGTIGLKSPNNYTINGEDAEFPSKTAAVGDTYRVVSPGNYAGIKCEVGDLLICINADPTGETTDWTVAQTNINGQIYHTINGIQKGFYSNDTDTFSIFAPTTAGAASQVLISTGPNRAPDWVNQSDIIAGNLTDEAKKALFTNLTYTDDDTLTVTIGGTTKTATIRGRRAVNVNSEEKLSTSDSTALNFINGNGVSFTWNSTNKNLSVNANTGYETNALNKNYAVKTDDTTNNLYVNVPWIDTTYDVVSKDANGLAPQLIPNNGKFITQEFYLLAAENDQATPGWYRLSNSSLINTWRTIKVGGTSIGDKSLNFMPTGDIYVKTVGQNINPDPDTDNEFDIGFGIAWYNISTKEYEYE